MRKLAVLLGFIGQCWTLQEGSWRKRVGVEPTKDRLTAPAGFEVRPPHRGRFSSNELGTALDGKYYTKGRVRCDLPPTICHASYFRAGGSRNLGKYHSWYRRRETGGAWMASRYKADHVGSFLRPPELRQAFHAHRAGGISDAQLRQATDRAVVKILQVQKDAGLEIFSDGEYRRGSWLSGPLDAFEGFVNAGDANRAAPQNQTRWRGAPTDVVPMQGATGADADAGRRQRVIGAKLKARRRLNGDEAAFLRAHAPGAYKITNPGPTWFLRYWAPGVSDKVYGSRDAALDDLVAITRQEIAALVSDGVPYIQIDSIRYVFIPTRSGGGSGGNGASIPTSASTRMFVPTMR